MITGFENNNLPSPSCDLPPAITDAQAFVVSAREASLSWKAISYSTNPVTGYEVQYRAIESEVLWSTGPFIPQQPAGDTITVTFEDLQVGALYEFRVRPVTEDDCGQRWDATLPKVKLPPLTPFTDPDFVTWLQPSDKSQTDPQASATSWFMRAAPISDGTVFIPQATGAGFLNGLPTVFTAGVAVTLNRADYADFPANAPTVLQAEGPASVFCWERRDSDGNVEAMWSPARPWHLSTDLMFGAFRNTRQVFHIYSLPGTAPMIDVYRQGVTEAADVLVASLTGAADSAIRYFHDDASDTYGFRSDQPVVVFHWSNTDRPDAALDQKPINPPALRIIMAETRNAAIAARYDGTAPSAKQSDVGSIGAVPVGRDQGLVYPGAPAGPGQYAGLAVQFDGGNLPIVGGPGADGDGTAQTLGQDIDTLGTRIRLPGTSSQSWQFMKVASPFPFTLTQSDPAGAVVNTFAASGVGPYTVYLTGGDLVPNHLYEADARAIFVVEETASDDETVIWSL